MVDLTRRRGVLAVAALATLVACKDRVEPPPAQVVLPPGTRRLQSAHYVIDASASEADAQATLAAVESLHRAYFAYFDLPEPGEGAPKHRLVLYRDRAQFKQFNRSRPWAEAYYLPPACHADYAREKANPHHWMLHEATHQLNREVSGFPRTRWTEEGLGTYFGASRLIDGELHVGLADLDAYPLWWLSDLRLSGDVARDIREQSIVGLRALITGRGGPPMEQAFNHYYLGYWSLTRFLFEYDNGRYAGAFRQLIRKGGALSDFELLMGPVDAVQAEWYAVLRETVAAMHERPRLQVR